MYALKSNQRSSWFAAPAALRLYHYYDTGNLGFKQDCGKADRYLNQLKTISPDLSDENIQQMKLELSELIVIPSSADKKEQSEEDKILLSYSVLCLG